MCVAPFGVWSQISISMGGTQDIPCGQVLTFTDSNPGGPYGPNENHQITVCADGGNAVSIEILTIIGQVWDVAEGDFLFIYDGPDTNAPLFGSFNSTNSPLGVAFSTSIENTSQCLTLVFTSDGAGQGQGWAGTVSCGSAWQPFSVTIATDPADGMNLPGYVDICPGESVNFSAIGDFPYSTTTGNGYEQSDNTMFYRWSMGDGSIYEGIGLSDVDHTFTGQFGYTVTLRAVDPLGQFRLDTIKVRVSTTPDYQTAVPDENPICLGGSTIIVGGYIDEENYAGFEPIPGSFFTGGISAGQVFLPDAVFGTPGVYTDTLFVTGMVPGATITDASDLIEVCLNIEHSFLGDLEIWLQCPSGEVVPLINTFNGGMFPVGGCGGGGTYLGDANDGPAGSGPGIGFDYCFSMDAVWGNMCQELAAGNTVPVNTFQPGNAMAPGTYQPHGSYAAYVGCPVEGPWVLFVQDNLGADDGYIFEWSIQPSLDFFPDAETYTPEIVDAFWSPDASIVNDMGLSIEVQPEAAGSYMYQFVVIDNFGCQYDTTISLLVVAPPLVDAGENVFLACGDPELDALIDGQNQPQCSSASGQYSYCYGNSENTIFTYCPDNPGDGITFLTLDFISGSVENNWDFIWVYDGPDIGSPVIAGPLTGNMAGQTFTATNNGCITFRLQSDGSISCQSGSQQQLVYELSCTAGPQYIFSWDPTEFLDDPNVLNPTVIGLTDDQMFTLTVYPVLAPQCIVSDQVLVSIGDAPSPGEDASIIFCQDGPQETLIDYLGGEPDEGGVWLDPDGNAFNGDFDPSTDVAGTYTYAIPSCDVSAELEVEVVFYAIEVAEPDTTICQNGSAVLSIDNPDATVEYLWSSGANSTTINVSPLADDAYSVIGTYGPGCLTNTVEFFVTVLPGLSLTVSQGGNICPGESLEVSVQSAFGGLEPYSFSWTSESGEVFAGDLVDANPEFEGDWCATLIDACESTPAVECVFIGLAEEIDVTFTADTLGGCVPVTVFFQSNAENTDAIETALWEFGNGTISSNLTAAVGGYQQQGLYTITYSVTSVDGCFFTHTEENMITVYNQPFASFSIDPQTIVLPNTTADFLNFSQGSNEFVWIFNQTDSIDTFNASYDFPATPGVYPVTLLATNPWGCADSLTRNVVVVEEFTMFIPNAFTPDQDGINDVWRFEGIDIDENHFELMIFNRWGEVIHRTNDVKAGWNGNVNNGDYYVPDGVYFYRIDTRSKTTQDNKVVSGHILIIR